MLVSTQALALRAIKYTDNSRVVKLYTRQLGMQSYLVQGIHKPKSAITMAHFQPLTELEVVVYHKPGGALQRIKEARSLNTDGHGFHYDVAKSSVAMFLCELLYHSIQEEEPNEALYVWLQNSTLFLNAHQGALGLFPHWLMVHLSAYLGFFPLEPEASLLDKDKVFDLEEGAFLPSWAAPRKSMASAQAYLLHRLMQSKREEASRLNIESAEKRQLLQRLLRYYQLQMPGFQRMKTSEVLEQLSG